MRFWDASAVVSLVADERATSEVRNLLADDPSMVVWWTTKVECASAVARREREHAMSPDAVREALAAFDDLASRWHVVDPVADVRDAAIRLLRTHELRASDALQLAAAYFASGRRPPTLEFVCRGERLSRAAEREGFIVR